MPLANMRFEPRAWPRECLDSGRVDEFAQLYRVECADALPPVELVSDGQPTFLIADGLHRREAARQAGLSALGAVVLPAGTDPIATAFLHALQRTATSAKPLTLPEKRASARRLLRERPQMSDREVGRLVGLDHKTVGKQRQLLEVPNLLGDGTVTKRVRWPPTPEATAKKLFKAFEKAYEARGLGIADFFTGDRTGERLAAVLEDVYGERALERAQAFSEWTYRAALALEDEAG